MTQILLHKKRLPKKMADALFAQGVIAIQTDTPEDFKFLAVDTVISQFTIDDMMWAVLDAAAKDNTFNNVVAGRLLINLKSLAEKQKAKRDAKAAE